MLLVLFGYPGGLMDIEFVHEAMQEPLVTGFLNRLETEEILPIVPPVPNTDLGAYFNVIRERFANPEVADTVRRLCLDGSNRQPEFIVPSIRDNRVAGRLPSGLILASALWCRYCAGVTDSGTVIAPNDPNWDALTVRAQAAKTDPSAWLAMTDIYAISGRTPPSRQPSRRPSPPSGKEAPAPCSLSSWQLTRTPKAAAVPGAPLFRCHSDSAAVGTDGRPAKRSASQRTAVPAPRRAAVPWLGGAARVSLMAYPDKLTGRVTGIGRGIAVSNAQPDGSGLATVNPVFTWVRLAQRVPVRVVLDQVPPDLVFAAGLTATVSIIGGSGTASAASNGRADATAVPQPAKQAP